MISGELYLIVQNYKWVCMDSTLTRTVTPDVLQGVPITYNVHLYHEDGTAFTAADLAEKYWYMTMYITDALGAVKCVLASSEYKVEGSELFIQFKDMNTEELVAGFQNDGDPQDTLTCSIQVDYDDGDESGSTLGECLGFGRFKAKLIHRYECDGDSVNPVTPPGGGGTMNYNALENKPSINGVELIGDKAAGDLGLVTPADVPVLQEQADWDQSDSSDASYIKNKPTIPDPQVQSDWDESDSASPAYIRNKPPVQEQVQSDWDESDSSDASYIKNKPTIPTTASEVGAMKFDGLLVEALTSDTIPASGKIYTYTPSGDTTFVFPTVDASAENLFEIDLTMPDPAVTVTWPSGLVWKFATPTLSAGSTTALRFRHTGSNWEGWTTPDMSEYALVSNVVPKSGGRFTDTIKVGKDDNVRNSCFINNKAVGCSSLGAGFISASNWFTSTPAIPYLSSQNLILVNTWFHPDYLHRCVFVGDDFSVSGRNDRVFAFGRGLIVPTNRTDVFITGEYNVDTDAYLVVGNGTSNNDRSNCFVVDRSGNVTASGSVQSKGLPIESLTSSTIPDVGVIYQFAPTEATTLVFPTPVPGKSNTFRLDITMGATAVAVTFPGNVTWNPALPTLASSTTTQIEFEWQDSDDSSTSESGPVGTWVGTIKPDMSEYALAADYVPKTGGTFSGGIYITGGLGIALDPPWSRIDPCCLGVGYRLSARGRYSFALGYTAATSGEAELSIGYTSASGHRDYSLVVCKGSSARDKIGFQTRDGDLYIAGDLTFTPTGGTETTLSSIVSEIRDGQEILTPEDSSDSSSTTTILIAPQDNKVYKHLLATDDVLSFDLSSLTSAHQVTFEVHLTQPSTAVTFTLPSGVIWANGDAFASGNAAPTMNTANTLYCLVFRWDGGNLLGNLAYSKAVAA